MGRLIAVTSGKGGVGKSSVSVHLATALALKGSKVLLIDLDAGMRCLDIMLSVSDRLLFDLNDVLSGEKMLEDAVLKAKENVFLLAAPLKFGIDTEKLKGLLTKIVYDYDYIFLDFPAGGVNELYHALPRYCEALVVCNADAVSVRDAAMVAEDLRTLNLMSVRLVLNRVSLNNMRKGITANVDEVIDSCGLQLIGVIPQSMDIYMANCTGTSVNKKSKASAVFGRIAKRLEGYDVPLAKIGREN